MRAALQFTCSCLACKCGVDARGATGEGHSLPMLMCSKVNVADLSWAQPQLAGRAIAVSHFCAEQSNSVEHDCSS